MECIDPLLPAEQRGLVFQGVPHGHEARDFAANGHKFHRPPEGNAAQAAVREGTSGLAFVDWFQRTYESTLLSKLSVIDWNKYKQHGAATLTSIVTHCKVENGGDTKLSTDEAAQMLKTVGFPVASSVQIPAQYNESSKAKVLNKAVKAARRDRVEVAGGAAASE